MFYACDLHDKATSADVTESHAYNIVTSADVTYCEFMYALIIQGCGLVPHMDMDHIRGRGQM